MYAYWEREQFGNLEKCKGKDNNMLKQFMTQNCYTYIKTPTFDCCYSYLIYCEDFNIVQKLSTPCKFKKVPNLFLGGFFSSCRSWYSLTLSTEQWIIYSNITDGKIFTNEFENLKNVFFRIYLLFYECEMSHRSRW